MNEGLLATASHVLHKTNVAHAFKLRKYFSNKALIIQFISNTSVLRETEVQELL